MALSVRSLTASVPEPIPQTNIVDNGSLPKKEKALFLKPTVDFNRRAVERLFGSRNLLTMIFSFLGGGLKGVAETSRNWNNLAGRVLLPKEFGAIIQDQIKRYSLPAIAEKVAKFSLPSSHIRELDFRTLSLNPKNLCSEHLISTIVRSCPQGLHTLRLPAAPCAGDADKEFIERVFFAAFQSMPKSVKTLDLRMDSPGYLLCPFTTLQNQQIDSSKVTHLLFSDGYYAQDMKPFSNCFPALTTLEVQIIANGRISLIHTLITQTPRLQHLKIIGVTSRALVLIPADNIYSSTTSDTLRVVELVNCVADNQVVSFFKTAAGAPRSQVILTNCTTALENVSVRLNADAWGSLGFASKQKSNEKKSDERKS